MPKGRNPWEEIERLMEKMAPHLKANEYAFLATVFHFLADFVSKTDNDAAQEMWRNASHEIMEAIKKEKAKNPNKLNS